MNVKKIIALTLAVVMLASFTVGCKNDSKPQTDVPAGVVTDDIQTPNEEIDNQEEELSPTPEKEPESDKGQLPGNIQTPEEKPEATPDETVKEPQQDVKPPIPMPEEKPQETEKNVTLDTVYNAVKNAYGDNYGPDYKVEEKEFLLDMFGVNLADVSEYFVEMAMMSSMVDKFVGIKAVSGKADAVETALKSYLQNEIENGFNYPSNVPKVANAKVIKKGDLVFLMMLGKVNENIEATEEEMVKHAQEQIAIGVDALNACFK